jgi:serine/threonine protein kinase
MIGRVLGHYRILEKIGSGGMGEVYRARDERLKRDVAIKILSPQANISAETRHQLLREAQSASALNDPHICTIHEVGEADGKDFIVMEFVEGHPLSALIPAQGLPGRLVLRYGTQIAAALAHAQERGVIHRDIRPSNIVITPTGQVKILDFGLAKLARAGAIDEETLTAASKTRGASIVGTLPYISPELLCGKETDARSDIWALGVVLYEMAAGKRPFRAQTPYELTSAILRETPASMPAAVPCGAAIHHRTLSGEGAWTTLSARRRSLSRSRSREIRRGRILGTKRNSAQTPRQLGRRFAGSRFNRCLTVFQPSQGAHRPLWSKTRWPNPVASSLTNAELIGRSRTRLPCEWHDRRTDH